MHVAEVNDIICISLPRTHHSITQLLELDSRIQKAYEDLPPDLAYRQMSSAELDAAGYAYHMQFYSTRIMLHRALISSSLEGETLPRQSIPLANSTLRYTPDSSSKTMYDSAVCITELAVNYRQIFGLDKMITVMLNTMYMAAITLINHVLVLQHQGVHSESDIRRIRQLLDTLNQIQIHFPVASRMHQTLSEILSGTSLPSLDCIPLNPTLDKSSFQPSAISHINSWGAMGTPVENHAPPVSLDFSGMFDERYQP